MDLNKLIQLTLKNEGASLSFNSGNFNPNSGFFSSYKDCELKIKLSDFNEPKLKTLIVPYLVKYNKLVRTQSSYIGTWIHEGIVYLDISKQFISEADCSNFARENEQLFYYKAASKQLVQL